MKYHTVIILTAIIVVGFLLRFYQLGQNPPGLTWDEASLGYNAYSLLDTGRDEYGNSWPVTIRSFDDNKPPLYVYLTIPFVAIFGLNEFSVRFLSALLGSMTVVVMYFLANELLKDKKNKYISLLAGVLLAISPWHLQFSRAAFEGNIGLFFFTLGMTLLLIGRRKSYAFIFGTISLAMSMYSYHSFRLLVPVFVGVFFLLFSHDFRKRAASVAGGLLLLILLVVPIVINFATSAGTDSRLSMVTIFSGHDLLQPSIEQLAYDRERGNWIGELVHNRRVVYFREIAKNYLDHFDPRFLFIFGDGGRQHHAVDMGMLYLVELPFLIAGFAVLFIFTSRSSAFILLWLILAPLPAAITTGTPHPVRAIAMVPVLHLISAVGIVWILGKIRAFREVWGSTEKKIILGTSVGIVGLMFLGNVIYYFHQYYVHTPLEYGDFWQAGYKPLFESLKQKENKYERIIVTYYYDQPYIYYLFYNTIDPGWYQNNWDQFGTGKTERMFRKIGKYEFRPINWGLDQSLTNTLIAAAPHEIPPEILPIETIYFPNHTPAFVLVAP